MIQNETTDTYISDSNNNYLIINTLTFYRHLSGANLKNIRS